MPLMAKAVVVALVLLALAPWPCFAYCTNSCNSARFGYMTNGETLSKACEEELPGMTGIIVERCDCAYCECNVFVSCARSIARAIDFFSLSLGAGCRAPCAEQKDTLVEF